MRPGAANQNTTLATTRSTTVAVDTADGLRRFKARNIVIASGSDISVPPIPGIEHCLNSRDLYALHPSLSTVHIDGAEIGRRAADVLIARGRGEASGPAIVDIGFQLVLRGSTGDAA